MGTELPTKVMLGQTLVLMQMPFLNNVRKVGRLILSRTSCFIFEHKKARTECTQISEDWYGSFKHETGRTLRNIKEESS
jgi:hypothetical protein